MLDTADSYAEKDWQTKILGLLLFVFPKYITVLENVHIKDFYSSVDKATNRYIDLVLVDANGSIDIVEIKRPRVKNIGIITRHEESCPIRSCKQKSTFST